MATEAEKNAPGHAVSRRSFLTRLWLGFTVLVAVEIAWVAISFLRPRRLAIKQGDVGGIVEAGTTESFEPGSVTAFPRGPFYLVRLMDGGFLALSCKCTHLGCTVPWVQAENRFVCPCHASTFDITGNVIGPPAPRALDLFVIFIENNVVKVDVRKPVRRTEFRNDQVVYPQEI